MRLASLAPVLAAIGLVLGAQALADAANARRATGTDAETAPYAPSPGAAPFVVLGYREAGADYLWIRSLGYFGGGGATSPGVRHLVEAIAALDPAFEEPMTWGATAMQSFTMQISQDDYHQVLRVLADAMRRFPDNYRLPQRAGEIYALRLTSDDPAELRRYKQEGARLLSKAIHMPNAPKRLGTLVAHLRSELGQRDLAIRDLRELILYTSDGATRRVLVDKLAKLTSGHSETIDYELEVEARRFDEAWHRDRPEFRPSDYAVIGPRVPTWFDPAALGAPDDVMLEPVEPLPPLADGVGELPMVAPEGG